MPRRRLGRVSAALVACQEAHEGEQCSRIAANAKNTLPHGHFLLTGHSGAERFTLTPRTTLLFSGNARRAVVLVARPVP
jgi:hypothetical protein